MKNIFNAPLFSKRGIFGVLLVFLLIVGLLVTIYQVKIQQEIRQRAAAPTAVCPVPNGTTCSWVAATVPSGYSVSYHVTVINKTTKDPVLTQDVTTLSVSFTSTPGQTYTCTVTVNFISTSGGATCPGTPSSVDAICPGPSPTGTPTPTPTTPPRATPTTPPGVTPTNTPTPTATGTPAPTATPTPTRLPTATPIPTVTSTPTPTQPPTPTATGTPAPTATPTPTPLPTATPTSAPPPPVATNTPVPPPPAAPPVATNTPRPTLPPTGSVSQTIGIVGIVMITIIGGILLLAL